MFFKGSRYAPVPTAEATDAAGRTVRYKRLRFIETPTKRRALHTVTEDDRLDRVADRYYSDPERFWRICDANLALWPGDLLEVGRRLRIPPAQD